jgi:phage-related protein
MPRTEVLFYQEDEGTVPVDEWLCELPKKVQAKCQAYLRQLEDFGHELRRPVADFLRDGIYELRPSYQGVQYRMLYFFPKLHAGETKVEKMLAQRVVVLSHGFAKTGAVPDAEIDRAIQRKIRFEVNPKAHTFKPGVKR